MPLDPEAGYTAAEMAQFEDLERRAAQWRPDLVGQERLTDPLELTTIFTIEHELRGALEGDTLVIEFGNEFEVEEPWEAAS